MNIEGKPTKTPALPCTRQTAREIAVAVRISDGSMSRYLRTDKRMVPAIEVAIERELRRRGLAHLTREARAANVTPATSQAPAEDAA